MLKMSDPELGFYRKKCFSCIRRFFISGKNLTQSYENFCENMNIAIFSEENVDRKLFKCTLLNTLLKQNTAKMKTSRENRT
jgi:hypothetical protein